MSREIQALRCIDKADKIGIPAVTELLQKPEHEFGAGLDSIRAGMVGLFLTSKGEDNEKTLANLQDLLSRRLPEIRTRLGMLIELERNSGDGQETALDRLLSLSPNDDETWNNGGRPKNIGWALDDLVEALHSAFTEAGKIGGAS